MAYVTVYSPDGQKFEVASHDRACKLLLEDGWTQSPSVEEKPKKAPTRRKKKEEPVEEKTFESFTGFNDSVEPEDEEPKEDDS